MVHDSIERAWAAALPDDWAPAEASTKLRIGLSEVTDLIQAAGRPGLVSPVRCPARRSVAESSPKLALPGARIIGGPPPGWQHRVLHWSDHGLFA